MSMPKVTNLYDSLMQRGSVSRMGQITVMRMDGCGAIATTTLAFMQAMRWAQARQASNNLQKDRMQFLERIDTLIAKPGSITPSRGSTRPLMQLLRDMEAAGLEPTDWNVPTMVKAAIEEESKTHGVSKKSTDEEPGSPTPEDAETEPEKNDGQEPQH